ncbi:MAG TPA: hypothetical protein V6D25_11425 [Leptolyngbyaceae cyanobacterium]
MEYERTKAIASLDEGKPVIPVWLHLIYQWLASYQGSDRIPR